MLAQLIIILGGTDKKAMPTFSLQLLLEEMEQAAQRYALPEKLCKRLFLAYRSGNANAGGETDSPRLTPTHLSGATATLLFLCDRLTCCYSLRYRHAQTIERFLLACAKSLR